MSSGRWRPSATKRCAPVGGRPCTGAIPPIATCYAGPRTGAEILLDPLMSGADIVAALVVRRAAAEERQDIHDVHAATASMAHWPITWSSPAFARRTPMSSTLSPTLAGAGGGAHDRGR